MATKLIIAIDLGASLTKCFYSWVIDGFREKAGYRTVCSAVQLISATQYEKRQYADNSTSLVKFEDEYWGVGENARQAVTNTNLQRLKFRDAIAKCLALVGQITRETVVLESDMGLHIELGILMPLNEMGNADELSVRLVRLLYGGFGHNGDQVKFKFVHRVKVSPEGYGICQIAKRSPAVVMMFGHKDFTLGCVQDQTISITDSRPLPGWGMLKLIRQIPYTFVDELRAAAAIYAAGEKLHDKYLLKVVPPQDLARVKAAIAETRKLVWEQLWQELLDGPIQDAQQVIAAGGNAVFWYPELKRHKKIGSMLSMGSELINEIRERFPELDKSPLLYRLADGYGFFKALETWDSYVPSAQKELLGGAKK